MKEVRTAEEVMEQLSSMSKINPVCQVFIPGKGKFMIVLQEEDYGSTPTGAGKEGHAMSASELTRNPF